MLDVALKVLKKQFFARLQQEGMKASGALKAALLHWDSPTMHDLNAVGEQTPKLVKVSWWANTQIRQSLHITCRKSARCRAALNEASASKANLVALLVLVLVKVLLVLVVDMLDQKSLSFEFLVAKRTFV